LARAFSRKGVDRSATFIVEQTSAREFRIILAVVGSTLKDVWFSLRLG
jgi:hypothetical protein